MTPQELSATSISSLLKRAKSDCSELVFLFTSWIMKDGLA
jgi:hypothetical protein